MKKEHVQNALLILIGIALILNFFYKEDPEPQPIQVIIPEQKGSTGTQIIENVKTIPIPIPGGTEIIVDEKWYKEYLEAKDSITRLNKYVQAIQVNELDTTFIDNDTIKLDGVIKTRGSLLSYKFDYQIKERKFEYTPEVIVRRPRLSLVGEIGLGVPTQPTADFTAFGALGLQFQNGFGAKVGYDTQGTLLGSAFYSVPIIK